MSTTWLGRMIQIAAFTLTVAAVLQELEKPTEARKGYGKVAGIVPYDFRLPTTERFKESYWNPYERRVLTPEVFGVGWAINLYRLLENLGFVKQTDVSEESFLMPTQSIKDTLTHLEPSD